MTIAIISAMHEELERIVAELNPETETTEIAHRMYHVGSMHGVPVVAVFSRWGKVAASSTATQVLADHAPRCVIFTGVAGAVDARLKVGDVVVADELMQHDMDGRPMVPRYEIPLLSVSRLHADAELVEQALRSAEDYVANGLPQDCPPEELKSFGIGAPRVMAGTIISGDRFIASTESMAVLKAGIPDALCVEMEGAVVAQVCYEHEVPCAVIRTISDTADESAGVDFPRFVGRVASAYSHGIVSRLVRRLAEG